MQYSKRYIISLSFLLNLSFGQNVILPGFFGEDLFNLNSNELADLLLDPAQLDGSESKPRRLGEKRAAQIVDALNQSRKSSLTRWIYAMGIPQIGESGAREISRLHKRPIHLANSLKEKGTSIFHKHSDFLVPSK